jgi:hypothetical protein
LVRAERADNGLQLLDKGDADDEPLDELDDDEPTDDELFTAFRPLSAVVKFAD